MQEVYFVYLTSQISAFVSIKSQIKARWYLLGRCLGMNDSSRLQLAGSRVCRYCIVGCAAPARRARVELSVYQLMVCYRIYY